MTLRISALLGCLILVFATHAQARVRFQVNVDAPVMGQEQDPNAADDGEEKDCPKRGGQQDGAGKQQQARPGSDAGIGDSVSSDEMQPKSGGKARRPAGAGGQVGQRPELSDAAKQCFDMVKTQFSTVRDGVKAACGSSLKAPQRDKASTSAVDSSMVSDECKAAIEDMKTQMQAARDAIKACFDQSQVAK